MPCRFEKTSFLKNGADEVGQECADLSLVIRIFILLFITAFFHTTMVSQRKAIHETRGVKITV